MSKTTITIMNIIVVVVWSATIIVNLLSADISKISYGICGFVLVVSWILKSVNDARICDLYERNTKLFKMYNRLLDRCIEPLKKTNAEEEDNDD